MCIVVVDHIQQGFKTPIVIKATFHMSPKTLKWSCPVAPVRRPICLEGVNADLFGSVHVPTWFCVKGWNMAACTHCLSFKKGISTGGGCRVKTSLWGQR